MLPQLDIAATTLRLAGLMRRPVRAGARSRRSGAWVLAAGLLALLAAGAGSLTAPPPDGPGPAPQAAPDAGDAAGLRPGITKATVINVVDGDTIDVAFEAGAELPAARVRLIGVDTPEVHGRTDPYGAEASAYTKAQLMGKTVWLEKDVSETDRYGRALRYVWLTEPPEQPAEGDIRRHLFNALLVLGGYATVSTYPPDVKYADLLAGLQDEAREAGRGLWGLAGQDCDPSYPDVCIPPPPPDLDCGDIPHRNFRVLPPDPHRLDGNGDGIGCQG